jgi:HD superfamily phosphodiesterase
MENLEKLENNNVSQEDPYLEGSAETDEAFRENLREGVEENYRQQGVGEQLITEFMTHNNQVEEFVKRFAAEEGFTAKEEEIAVLSAILHDVAKGYGEFVRHGEEGGQLAEAMLRSLGLGEELARSVRLAIERHMGREGFPARAAKDKFGEDHEYPEPRTKIGELLYKCDILTQLTPAGLRKIVALRGKDADMLKEDEEVAESEGITVEEARKLSALRSAKESLGIIMSGGNYPMEPLRRYTQGCWNDLKTEYPTLMARLKKSE